MVELAPDRAGPRSGRSCRQATAVDSAQSESVESLLRDRSALERGQVNQESKEIWPQMTEMGTWRLLMVVLGAKMAMLCE
jgi:hypothetical protein